MIVLNIILLTLFYLYKSVMICDALNKLKIEYRLFFKNFNDVIYDVKTASYDNQSWDNVLY